MWEFISAWAGRARRNPYPTSAVNIADGVGADYSSNPILQIYVGGAGNVKVRMWDERNGSTWATYAADKGAIITGLIVAVGATADGTTATGLVAHR